MDVRLNGQVAVFRAVWVMRAARVRGSRAEVRGAVLLRWLSVDGLYCVLSTYEIKS